MKKRGLSVREDVLAGIVQWCDDKNIRYDGGRMEVVQIRARWYDSQLG